MSPPSAILIATGNLGKAREIQAVLAAAFETDPRLTGIHWQTLQDLASPLPEPEEDQETFAGNAALKAVYYSKQTGMWTLADDSGLEVDALGGEPGVYSARYADASSDAPREVRDQANNRKLIDNLQDVSAESRTARFRCALALADGEHILATADGAIEGLIIDERRGFGGFGYDPHFWVPELQKTTAELEAHEKNRISHRGLALRLMKNRLIQLLAE